MIKRQEEWKTVDDLYQCPICGKKFSKNGICSHIWRMHDEQGKLFDTTKYLPGSGVEGWNKGLTKDTDLRVRLSSESLKRSIELNGCKLKGRKLSPQHILKISLGAQRGIKNGTWNLGNSWVKRYEYQSLMNGKVYLMGKWELEYAKYLDSSGIKWERNTKKFRYVSDLLPNESKIGYYIPDFYLVDEDSYVEIKGYETNLDHSKWEQFPMKLKVLRYHDLKNLGLKIY